ncbi:MAG: peptidoglycan-binding protein [Cyanobacteria bacterium J06632_22]
MIATTINKPVLRFGARGKAVQELQKLLNTYGYNLPVDGIFGAWTEGVVKDFQFVRFLGNDGIVGNKTWRALFTRGPIDMPVLRLNNNRDEVKIVQDILSRLVQDGNTSAVYYPDRVDGRFGIHTEQAVKAFQTSSGLEADGIVGHRTWHTLSKHGFLLYDVEMLAA